MVSKKNWLGILAAMALVLGMMVVGCDDGSGGGVYNGGGDDELSEDVYIAGYDGSNAVYWKNGEQIILDRGGDSARANSIFVFGNDVYIAGYDGSNAVYWKNGQQTTLFGSEFNGGAEANSIFVSGNDVYVAGYCYGNAVYWKNGEQTTLFRSDHTTGAHANSIFVSGNDVYVAGYDGGNAVYWKNGEQTTLYKFSYTTAVANSIFVSGNDVYVAGHEYENSRDGGYYGHYWKNGERFSVRSDGRQNGNANSVFVSDNNVFYIAGSLTGEATIWRNGSSRTTLPRPTGSSNAYAYSIFVIDSDVHSAGYSSYPGYDTDALYWKNGTMTVLPSTSSRAYANSIFVNKEQKGFFTVTFESNGGSDVPAQTVFEGDTVGQPSDPYRNGYPFDGWYANFDLTIMYDFNAPVYYDMILWAGWGDYDKSYSGGDNSNKNILEGTWVYEYYDNKKSITFTGSYFDFEVDGKIVYGDGFSIGTYSYTLDGYERPDAPAIYFLNNNYIFCFSTYSDYYTKKETLAFPYLYYGDDDTYSTHPLNQLYAAYTKSTTPNLQGAWETNDGRVITFFSGNNYDYKVNGSSESSGTFRVTPSGLRLGSSDIGNYQLSDEINLTLSNFTSTAYSFNGTYTNSSIVTQK